MSEKMLTKESSLRLALNGLDSLGKCEPRFLAEFIAGQEAISDETAQALFQRVQLMLDEQDATGGQTEKVEANEAYHPENDPRVAAVVMLVSDEMMKMILALSACYESTPTMVVHHAITDYIQRHRKEIEQQPIYKWMLS